MIVKTFNISNELSDNDRVRLNTLIHPNEMGEKFKVMNIPRRWSQFLFLINLRI